MARKTVSNAAATGDEAQTDKISNRERFRKYASIRVGKIIEAVDSFTKCANPLSYEYTREDVQRVFDDLTAALGKSAEKFNKALDNPSVKPKRERVRYEI